MAGAALPIGLILAQQGIGALSRLIGQEKPPELPNLRTLMQTITSQGATQAAANRSAIRGFGASRRLSAGATSSALAGASIEANRSTTANLARAESLRFPIARLKEQRFQFNRGRRDNFANFTNANLGALGKILLLNNQGLLDNPLQDEESGIDFTQQGAQVGGGLNFSQFQQQEPQSLQPRGLRFGNNLPPGLMELIFQNN